MSLHRLMILMSCMVVPSAQAKDSILSYGDGKQDSKRSLGGNGHAIRFERPSAKFTVTGVQIYGSRYGGKYDAFLEVARISLCDASLKAIASTDLPLEKFATGNLAWVDVPLGPLCPPAGFYVHVDFFATSTKGVYLGIDAESKGHSITGTLGKPGDPLAEGDWMIRVLGTDRPRPGITLDASSRKVLSFDDGQADDKRSMAGAGHAVQFTAPSGEWYLGEVSIHGSLYGGGYDPERTFFNVFVCDPRLRVLSRSAHPYSLFSPGEDRWVTLNVPPVRVSGGFIILVSFNPAQTKGIYCSIDHVKKSHSLIAMPNRSMGALETGQEWMIRAGVMKRGKGVALPPPKEAGEGPDAIEIAQWRSSLDALEEKEDLTAIKGLLASVAKKSKDAAEAIGKVHTSEHAFIRYVNVPDEYAESVARLYETADGILKKSFGFESGICTIKGKRLHVHLLAEKGSELSLWTSPGSVKYPLIVNTMPSWERGLSPPSKGGPHIVYGLLHELGHVLMGWEDCRHQWAHYLGSLLVEDVLEALGEETWPQPYDIRAEGMARFMGQIKDAKPDRSTDAGTAMIFYKVGETFGLAIWGKASAWIRKNRKGKPFQATRLYLLDDLRDALVALGFDAKKVESALGGN
jgi:hypothetical protein